MAGPGFPVRTRGASSGHALSVGATTSAPSSPSDASSFDAASTSAVSEGGSGTSPRMEAWRRWTTLTVCGARDAPVRSRRPWTGRASLQPLREGPAHKASRCRHAARHAQRRVGVAPERARQAVRRPARDVQQVLVAAVASVLQKLVEVGPRTRHPHHCSSTPRGGRPGTARRRPELAASPVALRPPAVAGWWWAPARLRLRRRPTAVGRPLRRRGVGPAVGCRWRRRGRRCPSPGAAVVVPPAAFGGGRRPSRARRAPACAPAGATAGRASRMCRRRRNRQAFARPWPCLAAIRATAFAEQSCKALSRAFESSRGRAPLHAR